MNKKLTLIISLFVLSLFLFGCGSTATPNTTQSTNPNPHAPSNTSSTSDQNQYEGAQNLSKLESLASSKPNDANAQLNAGISAYTNKDYTKALEYYNKVIKINAKSGQAYNNIGNVYFRALNKPAEALPYYKKAVQVQPSYSYSWMNLVLCQQQLGDTVGAKSTINQGIQALSSDDAMVITLKQLLNQMK